MHREADAIKRISEKSVFSIWQKKSRIKTLRAKAFDGIFLNRNYIER
jgi:hypothetical protein